MLIKLSTDAAADMRVPQTIASAAACVFLVALGATIVLDAVHKSSAPSAARISDAVKGLAVSGSSSAAGGFFLRAGLSPKHHAPGADLAWKCSLLLQRRRMSHISEIQLITLPHPCCALTSTCSLAQPKNSTRCWHSQTRCAISPCLSKLMSKGRWPALSVAN